MTKFDPTKPVQTRDGCKAEIVPCDGFEGFDEGETIVYRAWEPGGGQILCACHSDGKYTHILGEEHPSDLINIPEQPITIERWFNIVGDKEYHTDGMAYVSYDEARNDADSLIVATVKAPITFTPGEGLDDAD